MSSISSGTTKMVVPVTMIIIQSVILRLTHGLPLGCTLHGGYPRVKLPEIHKIIPEEDSHCSISYNPQELEKPKSGEWDKCIRCDRTLWVK